MNDKKQEIWERIIMTQISKRDSFKVGARGWKEHYAAVEEIQKRCGDQFGPRLPHGTGRD